MRNKTKRQLKLLAIVLGLTATVVVLTTSKPANSNKLVTKIFETKSGVEYNPWTNKS